MESLAELPKGTVTFLFTDIEGSTELARRLGASFGRARAEHHRVVREAVARHHGHEIDTAGDGFFVAFERAGDAVAAAVDAQRGLAETEIRVRMGLHSAEPFLDDGGYLGVGVHRAARICGVGHGGQILLSHATAGIVEDLGLEGVRLLELGEHELKDIERPQRLFQVVADGLPAEFPPVQSLNQVRAHPAILTVLFTDLTGWGRLIRTLGDEAVAPVAEAYAELVTDAVTAEHGHVLELIGDSSLSRFEWPRAAFRAATAIRHALATEPWCPDDHRLAARMSIHSGRVSNPSSRYFGAVAMHGAALCDAAEPGQILVSHATEALVEGEILEVTLRDLGERTLSTLDRPVRVFELD